jgi:hypothetical protein
MKEDTRAGVKRRKLLLSTKNREAWSPSQQSGYSDHLQARWLNPAFRDGADLELSVTGAEAEAPAYYQKASLRDAMFSVPKCAKQVRRSGIYRSTPVDRSSKRFV